MVSVISVPAVATDALDKSPNAAAFALKLKLRVGRTVPVTAT